jgi:hypothetical protein
VLSEPWVFLTHAYRLCARPGVLLRAKRRQQATGIPPILVTALPHLTDDPEGLCDEL